MFRNSLQLICLLLLIASAKSDNWKYIEKVPQVVSSVVDEWRLDFIRKKNRFIDGLWSDEFKAWSELDDQFMVETDPQKRA